MEPVSMSTPPDGWAAVGDGADGETAAGLPRTVVRMRAATPTTATAMRRMTRALGRRGAA
jgi:hypothetical protein